MERISVTNVLHLPCSRKYREEQLPVLRAQLSSTLTVEKYFNVQRGVRCHGREIFPVRGAASSSCGCLDSLCSEQQL